MFGEVGDALRDGIGGDPVGHGAHQHAVKMVLWQGADARAEACTFDQFCQISCHAGTPKSPQLHIPPSVAAGVVNDWGCGRWCFMGGWS